MNTRKGAFLLPTMCIVKQGPITSKLEQNILQKVNSQIAA